MLHEQIQRLKDNIIPFVLVGLFVGIVIGKASWFRSFGPIRDFLSFSGINTRYPDSGQRLFFAHFDAHLLTYILMAILVIVGLWQLFAGWRGNGFLYRRMIGPLELVGSYLAIAWMSSMPTAAVNPGSESTDNGKAMPTATCRFNKMPPASP